MSPLPLHPVASAAVKSLGYVPLAAELRSDPKFNGVDGFAIIEFHGSGTYAFLIPACFYGLLQSGSIGKAYNRLLRGRFPAVKIT